MEGDKSRQIPLHLLISGLFVLLTLALGGLLMAGGYFTSRTLINSMADDMAMRIARETNSELQRILQPVETVVHVLAVDELTRLHTHDQRMGRLPLIGNLLDRHPALSSVYAGYENGDFFLVRQLRGDDERDRLSAPVGTRYMVQSIERRVQRGRYLYFDARMQLLKAADRPDYPGSFDPRKRDWYTQATAVQGTVLGEPYLFFTDRQVGVTMSLRSDLGAGVIGADLQLQTLNASLGRQKVTPGSQLALVDEKGRMLAHEDTGRLLQAAGADDRPRLATLATFGIPVLQRIAQEADLRTIPASGGRQQTVDGGDGAWKVSLHRVAVDGAKTLLLLIAVPQQELLASAYAQRTTAAVMILLIVLVSVPITWWVARGISRPLMTLTGEAEAIRRFEFHHPFALRSRIREVDQLAGTLAGMKRTIRQFLELSDTIAGESDFDRLLPRLLEETIAAAHASSGVLYLGEPGQLSPIAGRGLDGRALSPEELQQLRRVPLAIGPDGAPAASPEAAGPLMARALRTRRIQESRLEPADRAALGPVEALWQAEMLHATAVPLLNRRQELTGALLLFSHQSMEPAQVAFVAAFSGTAAVSLEAQALIKEQKQLFESFIRLVAQAIDAKSAYTGGHCARVPEVVRLLAQAACDTRTGPYQHFAMSDQDWEALRIAAWLHDCGKLTTPEYVVDKATRLETLYNRIHEVRMRFEVAKGEARLRHLERLLQGATADASQRTLDAEWQCLDDDFAFVARCNLGDETITPPHRERLEQIARTTWMRTLDDRLGLSPQELARYADSPPAPLPAAEPLLADRAWHRIERSARDLIPADNPWGFRMVPPPLLYDHGELHNLSTTRGTLTQEERHKINDHIVQTELMLQALPFPRHLQPVPAIASAHHEKLDGTGYPKGLDASGLSPQARMLAIADIFEALTASDRPYKKGLKLSEAISILARMRDDGHIDADLFDIFLRSGAFQRYAQQYMPPQLVDEVHVERFLRPAGAGIPQAAPDGGSS